MLHKVIYRAKTFRVLNKKDLARDIYIVDLNLYKFVLIFLRECILRFLFQILFLILLEIQCTCRRIKRIPKKVDFTQRCIVYIICKCISDLQSMQKCYVIHRVYEKRADYDQHDQSACFIRSKLIGF